MTAPGDSARATANGRRGRPPSAEAHQAILLAAYETLAQHGFAGMSMEAVAARAGVSKNTVYRRWSTIEDLVVDLVRARTAPTLPIEESGSIESDLASLIRYYVYVVTTSPLAAVLPALVDQMARSPKLAVALHHWFQDERRRLSRDFLARAVARGDVRADVDVDLVSDAAFGLVLQQAIVHGLGPDISSPEAMADLLLNGIRPTG